MPSPLMVPTTNVLCPHGSPAPAVPTQSRVLVDGLPALHFADQFLVSSCPASLPCVRIQWTRPAVRVVVAGIPALLLESMGLGVQAPGIPNGPAVPGPPQPRVTGS